MMGFVVPAKRYRVPSKQQIRVLEVLLEASAYGYDMMKALDIGPGTLYGLLKRLHDEAYVEKNAEIVEGRCRISYTLTPSGRAYAERALIEHEYEEGIKGMAFVLPFWGLRLEAKSEGICLNLLASFVLTRSTQVDFQSENQSWRLL